MYAARRCSLIRVFADLLLVPLESFRSVGARVPPTIVKAESSTWSRGDSEEEMVHEVGGDVSTILPFRF